MQKKRKTVLLFVPVLANIKQLLKDKGESKEHITCHVDKYHYFLHLVYTGSLFRYNIEDTNGYTTLKDSYLNDFLGRYRKTIKNNLIEWGIVVSDNHYIKGKKSKGYKISPEYHQRGYRTEVCINDSFENRIRNKKAFVNTLTAPEQYLFDTLKQVGIRADEALTYINNKLKASLELLHSFTQNHFIYYSVEAERGDFYSLELGDPMLAEEVERSIRNKYNADLLAINSIETGAFRFIVDDYGRVHTPLTNMSRKLRQFLFHVNAPEKLLYNLDLSCSQPFFLNILLKKHYGINLPESVRSYIEDTSGGGMYEAVMEMAGIPLHRRLWFKAHFFGSLFYCGVTTMVKPDNVIAQSFKKLYPEVFEFIKSLKSETDFRAFSRLMQKAESTAIIAHVVTLAQRENIWVQTIHDSCIVTEEVVQDVYTIIETVFREEYLLKPNIKVEALSKAEEAPLTKNEPIPMTDHQEEEESVMKVTNIESTIGTVETPVTLQGRLSGRIDDDYTRYMIRVITPIPVDKWNGYFSRVYLGVSLGASFDNLPWDEQIKMTEEDKFNFEANECHRAKWIAIIGDWKAKEVAKIA